jgi:hypothetical protein
MQRSPFALKERLQRLLGAFEVSEQARNVVQKPSPHGDFPPCAVFLGLNAGLPRSHG